MNSGRPPNMLGRFIKVNDTQQKCNGCNTIFTTVSASGDQVSEVLEDQIPEALEVSYQEETKEEVLIEATICKRIIQN
jgi:hypothetical protein